MNDWELEDVENTCKTNLNTFFIPALDERISQKKGDEVRLHFLLIDPKKDEPRAERMWVEVVSRKLFSKSYIGILQNQPAYIKNLKAGDKVLFEPNLLKVGVGVGLLGATAILLSREKGTIFSLSKSC